MRLMLALALLLSPFPSWGQVGRIALEAPAAPTPTVGGGASIELSPSALSADAFKPGLGLATVLPAASVDPEVRSVSGSDIVVGRPTVTVVKALKTAVNSNQPALTVIVSRKPVALPEEATSVDALFDGSLSKPDLDSLATLKMPDAPKPWAPKAGALRPFAWAWNAWRSSRHEHKIQNLPPERRITTEEHGIGETLVEAWTAAVSGEPQAALEALAKNFQGQTANAWFRKNPLLRPYQSVAHAYVRWLETRVKRAFERGVKRSREADLIHEALQAARDKTLLGHEWRRTAIQDVDSGHCAHHALFNAISASVGFAYPLSVHRFVERAREVLNVSARKVTGMSGSELAALEKDLGIKFGRDVGEGMGVDSIVKWASMLGMDVEARGPPKGDAGWSAVFSSGREALLSLRLFHEKFPHSPAEKELHGHDYRVLHHEVYLLGAFDSPSRGVRLYMVQDSGTGATEFFTAEELDALVSDVQYVSSPKKVALP